MSNIQFTNFAATTLASGINSVVTSLTVATGTGTLFPTLAGAQYFYCVLADAATGVTREVIKVTARSTDTFTITRAQDGTTGQTYITGDKVELRLTAAGIATLATTETAQTFAGVQTFSSAPVLSAPLAASGGGTGVANNAASTITMSGSFASTFVVGGAYSYTFPSASDTLVNLGSTQTLTAKTLSNPTITAYLETAPAIVNSSTAQTIALASGTVLSYTLTGNCTFTMPATTNGTSFIVRLIQDGTGGRTAAFTGVKWPAGAAPTITTTATTGVDILSFVCIASVWYGTYAQAFA